LPSGRCRLPLTQLQRRGKPYRGRIEIVEKPNAAERDETRDENPRQGLDEGAKQAREGAECAFARFPQLLDGFVQYIDDDSRNQYQDKLLPERPILPGRGKDLDYLTR